MSAETPFERLVADASQDLLAYAVRRTKSPEDAADVVAETFLIAWRKLDRLPPGDQARLWLFGVARNVLRRGIGKEQLERDAVERLGQELRRTIAPADSDGAPLLRRALASLPAAQREVLLLAAWEELSPREIATVTGVPVNLVRVRLHRGRTRLRRALEQPSLVRAACT